MYIKIYSSKRFFNLKLKVTFSKKKKKKREEMGEMINDPNEYVKLGRWISCKPNLFFCCFFLLPADVKNSSYT